MAVAYDEILMINISLQLICFMMSEVGGMVMVVDGKVPTMLQCG